MPNTEQLFYQTKKSSHQSFYIKTMFLKILQYSSKNMCEIFNKTYFEEHLPAAASELTL